MRPHAHRRDGPQAAAVARGMMGAAAGALLGVGRPRQQKGGQTGVFPGRSPGGRAQNRSLTYHITSTNYNLTMLSRAQSGTSAPTGLRASATPSLRAGRCTSVVKIVCPHAAEGCLGHTCRQRHTRHTLGKVFLLVRPLVQLVGGSWCLHDPRPSLTFAMTHVP